jgi:hypothetical protein
MGGMSRRQHHRSEHPRLMAMPKPLCTRGQMTSAEEAKVRPPPRSRSGITLQASRSPFPQRGWTQAKGAGKGVGAAGKAIYAPPHEILGRLRWAVRIESAKSRRRRQTAPTRVAHTSRGSEAVKKSRKSKKLRNFLVLAIQL